MTTSTRVAHLAKKPAKQAPTKPARRAPAQTSARRSGALAGATHVTPVGGNVFADLGFTPDEAENLRVRAQLMDEVRRLIDARSLTQAQAGALLGVTQPRVSDLVRGKIGLFTIDALINMLAHAGAHISVSVALDAA